MTNASSVETTRMARGDGTDPGARAQPSAPVFTRSGRGNAMQELAAADAAGLEWVSDSVPGIRRIAAGKGFRYIGPDGRPVRDAGTLARIRSLVIPPAWSDVWICPRAEGHIQAIGRD